MISAECIYFCANIWIILCEMSIGYTHNFVHFIDVNGAWQAQESESLLRLLYKKSDLVKEKKKLLKREEVIKFTRKRRYNRFEL